MNLTKEQYIEQRSQELAKYRKCSPDDVRYIAEREWNKSHTKQAYHRKGRFLFTSDLHFSHFNILRYDSRPFATIAEMNAYLINCWNKEVNDEDTVFILGDISWDTDHNTAKILKQLKGKKILVRGNHDPLGPEVSAQFAQIHHGYLEVQDPETRTRLVLSHYPIHFYNGQRKGAVMLYGHVHNGLDEDVAQEVAQIVRERLGVDFKMINVGCMLWDYTPRTLNYMLKH